MNASSSVSLIGSHDRESDMNFFEAIKSAFTKYVEFNGRASRSEFWYYVLFFQILNVISLVIDTASGVAVVNPLLQIGTFLPSLALTVRRLHDTDHTGWWYLGLGLIVPLYWLGFKKGDERINRFGNNPLGNAMASTGKQDAPANPQIGAPATTSSAKKLIERALRRLAIQGKGVSLPLPVGGDEVTLDMGYHPAGDIAYAIVTRDADEVALQLDFVIPSPDAGNFEQQLQRIASELTLQAEKRLPRLTTPVQEKLWDRIGRAKQQRRPIPQTEVAVHASPGARPSA